MTVIRLQAPFEMLKTISPCPNASLVRAIIFQAMTDATNTIFSNKDRQKALKWFYSEHFKMYCTFLEEDYTIVRKNIFNIIDGFLKKHNV